MDNKIIGTIGELAFMRRSLEHDIAVSTPLNTDSVYDCIIDVGNLYKIQIKTTSRLCARDNRYKFMCSKGRTNKDKYGSADIDFFALYIMPLDLFYILPLASVKTKTINIYPEKLDHRLSENKEAWHLFFK